WAGRLRDQTAGGTQYNQAWAMVHFLVESRDSAGQPRFRSRLIQMLKIIHAGTPGDSAFNQAFSDNVKGFQDRFVEYVKALTPTPTPLALLPWPHSHRARNPRRTLRPATTQLSVIR